MLQHENEVQDKRVESVWFPCLDEGSTPSSSTSVTPEEARKIIDQVDKMRENYVKKYTGTSRYDTRNYQLVITADDKTEEEIANFIMQYIG